LDNEEQEDKEKRAPTETRHNGSGNSFIHFLVPDLVDLKRLSSQSGILPLVSVIQDE
jgi:hypothetical protein